MRDRGDERVVAGERNRNSVPTNVLLLETPFAQLDHGAGYTPCSAIWSPRASSALDSRRVCAVADRIPTGRGEG